MNQINLTMEISSGFDLSVAVGKPSPHINGGGGASASAAAMSARITIGTAAEATYQEVQKT